MHCGNKFVKGAVWLLTALGALHLGLIAIGFNLWEQSIFQHELTHKLIHPLHYLVGLAGLASLVFFGRWVMDGECKK